MPSLNDSLILFLVLPAHFLTCKNVRHHPSYPSYSATVLTSIRCELWSSCSRRPCNRHNGGVPECVGITRPSPDRTLPVCSFFVYSVWFYRYNKTTWSRKQYPHTTHRMPPPLPHYTPVHCAYNQAYSSSTARIRSIGYQYCFDKLLNSITRLDHNKSGVGGKFSIMDNSFRMESRDAGLTSVLPDLLLLRQHNHYGIILK